MNRRKFIISSTAGIAELSRVSKVLGDADQSRGSTGRARRWGIGNRHLEIFVGEEVKGGLVSFIDSQTKHEFIAPKPRPLYELILFQKGKDLTTLTSLDATSLQVERSSTPEKETLTLVYGHHGSLDLSVTCSVALEADSPLSKWGISVKNNTPWGIRTIRYPVVVVPPKLGESEEDDFLLLPDWGGRLIRKPGVQIRSPKGRGTQYPGPVSLQGQAYYDGQAGIYMATYDSAGNIKSFGVGRSDRDLDLSIAHHYDERPGFSFDLPYDTVLGVFHGDWYVAADMYKEWAHKQHWCAKKTIERTDLPAWLREPRPWLAVITRGDYERLRWYFYPPAEHPIGKFYPAEKVVPLIRQYSSIFRAPAVTWMEGWEKIGSPGGGANPEIFPPYEGEESFKAAMAELNRDGNLPFMYLAAIHWTYKMPTTGYNDWPRFEREARQAAALNDHGGVDKHMYPLGLKYYVSLCISNSLTQELLLNNFMKLMDLGGVALQFDQQHGLNATVCYSEEHEHPPGYGPWMYKRMAEFVRQLRTKMKERNPESSLSYETACEIWIQDVDVHMHRSYMQGCIPLFDYIYGEYALRYGGDAAMGLSHPEVECIKHATCFVYGIQNLVGIGHQEYDFEVNPNYPILTLLRNTCEAQRTYAHEYLVFGQMLRPPDLKARTVTVDIWKTAEMGDETVDMPGVEVPKVLHSAWKGPSGKIGYVLVNWTGTSETATLGILRRQEAQQPRSEVYIVTSKERHAVELNQLQGGRLTLSVPPRGVLLIEQD